jgi:conjugal transfer pilus assembly protein TraD
VIRTFRWLVAVAAALVMVSPPGWVIAVTATIATVVVLAQASARVRHRLDAARDPPRGTVALGADAVHGARVSLTDQQLSAHALILGATGAGKSTTLLTVLTEHVRSGRPVVAIDMKGSPAFAKVLEDAAASVGRAFRLWTPDGPGRWNPLAHGNPTELKDKLIASERFTEPHYQRAAERYVQTVLQVLIQTHPLEHATLEEVVNLMEPRRIVALLRRAPRQLADRVQDYIGTLSSDQLSAIRGLGTRLALITESQAGAYLTPCAGQPAIDLTLALTQGDVVVFSLNSARYGGFASQLGTLAIQDLVAGTGHRLVDPNRHAPATVGIDEFSALGSDNVISLLARCRESGVSVLLATQELADLDRAAPGLRDQVLGSTGLKIIHRQDVPASARTVAQMGGTETVWEETRQTNAHPVFGGHDTGRGTRRQTERFVVHPNEISSLPPGEAVLITKVPQVGVHTVRVDPPRAPAGRGPDRPRAPAPRTDTGRGSERPRAPGRRIDRQGPELC